MRVRSHRARALHVLCAPHLIVAQRATAAMVGMLKLRCTTCLDQKGLLERGRSSTAQTIMAWPEGSMRRTFSGRLLLLCTLSHQAQTVDLTDSLGELRAMVRNFQPLSGSY